MPKPEQFRECIAKVKVNYRTPSTICFSDFYRPSCKYILYYNQVPDTWDKIPKFNHNKVYIVKIKYEIVRFSDFCIIKELFIFGTEKQFLKKPKIRLSVVS